MDLQVGAKSAIRRTDRKINRIQGNYGAGAPKEIVMKCNLENNEVNAVELQLAMMELAFDDFIGLAQIAGVNIFKEDNKIRTDFPTIEKEIIVFYCGLSKTERNKFLRRVRQIVKYNRTHKLEEFKEEENS